MSRDRHGRPVDERDRATGGSNEMPADGRAARRAGWHAASACSLRPAQPDPHRGSTATCWRSSHATGSGSARARPKSRWMIS